MVWLDIARIASIFCVIIIHVTASIVVSPDVSPPIWWVAHFYNSFSRWCVPVFVMISGALLLNKNEPTNVFFKKRLNRILIPISFWTVFYIFWGIIKDFVKTKSISFDASETFYDFLTGNIYPHLWFVYMIIGLYLFTPVFRILIQSISRQHLLMLIILGFMMSMTQTIFDFFIITSTTHLFWITSLYYIPYFLLGHVIATTTYNPKTVLLLTIFVASSVATALLAFWLKPLYDIRTALYSYDYLSISVIPASIATLLLLKKINCLDNFSSIVSKISQKTFGIYLVHVIFMEIFGALGYNLTLVENPVMLSLHILGLSSLIFFVSLIATTLISRIKYIERLV